ncbi:unnamed protein product [Rotaria magnacalcarata]|uniref:SOCS box domain-containing protein n=4 Tax=Rotaria magnacalcarata TaxID=392030 RepID=A0A815CSB2_9BILA|nr:unnamed protein product [Rotaria magnacalcarata]CAF1323305.1 unnamed protein product [Rotaria magnacalcarata]
MDNRDFWRNLSAAKLPAFNPAFISSSPSSSTSRYSSLIIWLLKKFQSFYRYFYVHLHDLIASSLFGYLTLNEKLYVAIHQNNFNKTRELLSRGALPTFLPANHNSMLSRLTKSNAAIPKYHIDTSLAASIAAHDSMLYMAVANNNFNLVRELIDYHDYGQDEQHTEVVSLCLAVKRDYLNIVGYLIDHGHINPNDRVQSNCKHCKTYSNDTQNYQFPLYHACRENRLKLVKYLIKSKHCDVYQLTTTYETCLHGAILGASENRFDTSSNHEQRYHIVKYLLAIRDFNINIGLNPLCVSLAYDNIYDYASLLLQHECNVNRLGWSIQETKRTNPGRNNYSPDSLDHPLNICFGHLCERKKAKSVADLSSQKQYALKLLNRNSNLYAMYDYSLEYPFLRAVKTGDEILVSIVLETTRSQINLDIIEPLISACESSYYMIVKLLVDFGFNPNTVMTERTSTTSNDFDIFSAGVSNFLQNLNRYCTISLQSLRRTPYSLATQQNDHLRLYIDSTQARTPLLALSVMSPWIFHPEKYYATIKTIENLFSLTPVDFSILPNRLAFYHGLVKEHLPIVYFCLENFCPVILLHNTIEFTYIDTRNHFSLTLFDIISLCCRLTSNNRTKRILLDAFAKGILRIYTLNYSQLTATIIAYVQLWLRNDDFIYDPVLLEHLTSLPYFDEIIHTADSNYLESSFGIYYQRMIAGKSRPMYQLKHLCRLKIRRCAEIYCEHEQTNMLKILPHLSCLPKTLHGYLFYTTMIFKLSSFRNQPLINHLLNKKSWSQIQWM